MKIGITNLKGGVGKTTLSINLAVCFAHMNYSVCIVDTDTNQNSLKWYGVRGTDQKELTVVGVTDANALTKTVDRLNQQHDVVIIDGTPSLSKVTTGIILCSDLIFTPIRTGPHDLRALEDFMARLEQTREIKEVPAYLVLNEHDERIQLHRSVMEAMKEAYPDIPILKSTLKSRTAYGEASTNGTGVYEGTDPKAKKELTDLTKEILKIAKTHSLLK